MPRSESSGETASWRAELLLPLLEVRRRRQSQRGRKEDHSGVIILSSGDVMRQVAFRIESSQDQHVNDIICFAGEVHPAKPAGPSVALHCLLLRSSIEAREMRGRVVVISRSLKLLREVPLVSFFLSLFLCVYICTSQD